MDSEVESQISLQDIDAVLAQRGKKSQDLEYLVKLTNKAYKDSIWLRASELRKTQEGRNIIKMLNSEVPIPYDPDNYYDPSFNLIDRILEQTKDGYLVKWKNQPYTNTTIEKDIQPETLERYNYLQKCKYSRRNGYASRPQHVKSFENPNNNKLNLSPTQIVTLNTFISCFNYEKTIKITTRREISVPNVFLLFCEYLFNEFKIEGPFLAVLPPELLHEWDLILNDSNSLLSVLYSGTPENRDIMTKYLVSRDGSLRFHILITSHDIFSTDIKKFNPIKWAFAYIASNDKFDLNIVLRHSAVIDNFESFDHYSKNVYEYINLLEKFQHTNEISDSINDIKRRFQLFYPLYDNNVSEVDSTPTMKYILCPLTQEQKSCIINSTLNHLDNIRNNKFTILKNELQRICHHPYLVPGNEILLQMNYTTVSSKSRVIIDYIKESVKNHIKLAIVSEFTFFLDIIQDYLEENNLSWFRERVNEGINLINFRSFDFYTDIQKADLIIAVDIDIDITRTKGNKKIIRLISPSEKNWKFFTDEKICKEIVVNGLYQNPKEDISKEIDHLPSDKSFLSEIIDMNDFWDDITDLERIIFKPKPEITGKLSLRQRNQLIRSLFSFGWDNWDKLKEFCGFYISQENLKDLCQTILRKVLSLSSDKTPNKYELINQIVEQYDSKDSEQIEFSDVCTLMLKEASDELLSTFILIRQFNMFDIEDIKALPDIQISKDMTEKWWSKELSKSLLRAICQLGFRSFDYFGLIDDEKILQISQMTNDLSMIGGVAINLLTECQKHIKNDKFISYIFVSEKLKNQWKKSQIFSICNFLISYGVPLDDYDSLVKEFNFTRENGDRYEKENYEGLVGDILTNAQLKLQNEVYEKQAELIIHAINTMKDLCFIFNGQRSDDEVIYFINTIKKWQKMPKLFSFEIEVHLLKSLKEKGYIAIPEIIKEKEIVDCFGKVSPGPMLKMSRIAKRVSAIANQIRISVPPSAEQIEDFKVKRDKFLKENPPECRKRKQKPPKAIPQRNSKPKITQTPQQQAVLQIPREEDAKSEVFYEEKTIPNQEKIEEFQSSESTESKEDEPKLIKEEEETIENTQVIEEQKLEIVKQVDETPDTESAKKKRPKIKLTMNLSSEKKEEDKDEVSGKLAKEAKQYLESEIKEKISGIFQEELESKHVELIENFSEKLIESISVKLMEKIVAKSSENETIDIKEKKIKLRLKKTEEKQKNEPKSKEKFPNTNDNPKEGLRQKPKIIYIEDDGKSYSSNDDDDDEFEIPKELNQKISQHAKQKSKIVQKDVEAESSSTIKKSSQKKKKSSAKTSENKSKQRGKSTKNKTESPKKITIVYKEDDGKSYSSEGNDYSDDDFVDNSKPPQKKAMKIQKKNNSRQNNLKSISKEVQKSSSDEENFDSETSTKIKKRTNIEIVNNYKEEESSSGEENSYFEAYSDESPLQMTKNAPKSNSINRIQAVINENSSEDNDYSDVRVQSFRLKQKKSSPNTKNSGKAKKNSKIDIMEEESKETSKSNQKNVPHNTIGKGKTNKYQSKPDKGINRDDSSEEEKFRGKRKSNKKINMSDDYSPEEEISSKKRRPPPKKKMKILYDKDDDEEEQMEKPAKQKKRKQATKQKKQTNAKMKVLYDKTDDYDEDSEEKKMPKSKNRKVDTEESANSRSNKNNDAELPLIVSQTCKVLDLGKIVYDRPAFHTERYVFPAGFKSSRIFKSLVKPNETAEFISEIVDDGGETPVFRVSSDNIVYEGPTATQPWVQILKEVNRINGISGRSNSVSGPEMFALSHPIIRFLTISLPDAEKCSKLKRPELEKNN
ncbi:F/Y-rich N-terminus family protein [Trichomonas vaginalis G3]|uniref:F/Y-rich N-terminus family protein n=1 Tax=Trichomonas vaginalis (strain ATCC PRA-98 / G3) TaxID=412133 RepID=A2ET83_TRIV3|nr:transforming growth factor beta regulated gene 1 family protein [Trichomonas vaginalis G3]EAY04136.1 F/Y-rich N-terminus family protein [Trichomonas vaginalis G3]KAI5549889.1 transforming growth factor beta regulated gene 1 family protein [Trichomonas vaginalis G3]|eukprot:XP_001316359.1 F/Y-rich N-terminus family protein [Trichomonas vaginalis G3]